MQFPEPTLTREFLSGFAEIWRRWVPLLLLLIWVGWATRRWWGGKLLLCSLVLLAAFAAGVVLRERALERATMEAWNKLRVPLPAAARIDGLQLAAGTMVRWNEERKGHLLTAELGSGQEVSPGVVFTGEVDHLVDEWWRGSLARDSVVRGWKCAAGKIDIHNSGELRWCLLSGTQKLPVGEVPAGTAVLLDPGDPSDALLHLPNAGMRANPGEFWIAPNEWFVLYADGELYSVPGPITLRGVSFESSVVLRYGDEDVTRWYAGAGTPTPPKLARPPGPVTGWRGDPVSPLKCGGGHIISKYNRITVPVSGDVVTTTHSDSSRPRSKPVLDSYHCDLGPAR
jgi:hypothetical protein